MSEASQLEGKIKVNALTAYLQPLVKKHEMNQELTYEDLTSSWQAVNAVLGKLGQDSASTITADLETAIKNVRNEAAALHKSQMILYQEAAKSNLLDWSEKWPLSPVPLPTNNLTCETYCKAVEVNARRAQPVWRITKANFSVLEQTYKRINQRSTELYNTSTKAINHDQKSITKDEKVVPKEQQQKEQQEKEPNEKQNDLKEKILAAKEKAAAKILAAKEKATALALKKEKEQQLQQVKAIQSQEEDEEGEIDENMEDAKTVPTPVAKSEAEKDEILTKDVKAEEKEDIPEADQGEDGEIEEEMEDGEVADAVDDTMVSAKEQNHEKGEEKSNQTETPKSTPTKPVAGRTTRRLSGSNNVTATTTTTKTPAKAPIRKKGTTGKPLQSQSNRGRGRGRGRGGVAGRA